MATLLQLINEALRRTGQTEVSTLLNAQTPAIQARDFLNDTYVEMLTRLRVRRLIKSGTLSTSPGIRTYALAADTDIDHLLDGSLTDAETRHPLQEQNPANTHALQGIGSGRPTHFYRTGQQIHLSPTPDNSYTLHYQYLITPSALTQDSDTTQLPEAWEKTLILGTQARLEKFLGESGTETYILYRDALAQLRSKAPINPVQRMRGAYRGYPG